MVTRDGFMDWALDPNDNAMPAYAMRIDTARVDIELPTHSHRKGQLVLALQGGVTCEIEGGLWMVPPGCGVWIPSGLSHSNRVTNNGRVGFLFVEPGAAEMPGHCCTLSITPLLHELINRLADLPLEYEPDSPTGRMVGVLLEELQQMPEERLYLPISADPRLRRIAASLLSDPGDRGTIADWAARVAMSERTLARLVLRETGMTFGQWRQRVQIIIALQRLAAGQPVQRISADLGYESVSAFITMFKKALGEPPARYFARRSRPQGISDGL